MANNCFLLCEIGLLQAKLTCTFLQALWSTGRCRRGPPRRRLQVKAARWVSPWQRGGRLLMRQGNQLRPLQEAWNRGTREPRAEPQPEPKVQEGRMYKSSSLPLICPALRELSHTSILAWSVKIHRFSSGEFQGSLITRPRRTAFEGASQAKLLHLYLWHTTWLLFPWCRGLWCKITCTFCKLIEMTMQKLFSRHHVLVNLMGVLPMIYQVFG